jgi:hypothetical protein
MQVKVEDCLSRAGVAVKYRAVTSLVNSELFGQSLRCLEHLDENGMVFRGDIVERRDVFSRANQKVHGSNGMDILESHNVVIFVHDGRRRRVLYDLAKNA